MKLHYFLMGILALLFKADIPKAQQFPIHTIPEHSFEGTEQNSMPPENFAAWKEMNFSQRINRFIVNRNPIKQRLDSIASYIANQSVLMSRRIFKYNTVGLETENSSHFLNQQTKVMENGTKEERLYDGKYRLTTYIGSNGLGTNWRYAIKLENTYNNADHILKTFTSFWHVSSSSWTPESIRTYTYDAKNYLVGLLDSVWNPALKKWIPGYRIDITNNPAGMPTQYLYLSYDAAKDTWFYTYREDFEYDQDGNELSHTTYNWDANTILWVKSTKNTRLYNANGKVTSINEFKWNAQNWDNVTKSEYNWNSDLNMILNQFYVWDDLQLDWKLSSYEDCVFDNVYGFNSLLLPVATVYDKDIYFNHKLTRVNSFNVIGGNVVPDQNTFFYYSSVNITNAQNIRDHEYFLSPNPATTSIKIIQNDFNNGMMDVQCLNQFGEQITNFKISGPETLVDVSDLSAGIYFLQGQSSGNIYRTKFIKL